MTRIRMTNPLMSAALGIALASQGLSQVNQLTGDTGRPLYEAIRKLQRLHGWLITYQDPPYEHPSDMEPPAAAVPGAPTNRHISPRELSISVTYPTPKAGTAEERRKTIDGVVESFSAAGAGHFRVYHNGAFSHVVPTSVKRLSGEEAALTSVCDSTVSMPSAKRTIHSSLTEILSQVSLQIKVPIASMASGNLFLGHQYQTEAQGENACDLLSGVMEDVNGPRNAIGAPPVHVAWAMLYDIAGRAYYFNVIPVVAPAPPRQPGLGTYVPQHADAPHSDRQQEK